MNRLRSRPAIALAVLLVVVCLPSLAFARKEAEGDSLTRELLALQWQEGPSEGRIGSTAVVQIPAGYTFLDDTNTKRFLELNGNPPRDNHYTLAPQTLEWFAVFTFNPGGYVRDDENLDADALMRTLQKRDGASNEERRRLGMPALHTLGWHVLPHYDPETNRLEWGVRLRTEDGAIIVNYTTRLLGRRGVMQAVLVSNPEQLTQDTIAFKTALKGVGFVPGERYSEFRSGDKVAAYGLSALIVGGAAAAAVKTGAGKSLGKLLLVGILAVGSAIAAIFRRLFRRERPD